MYNLDRFQGGRRRLEKWVWGECFIAFEHENIQIVCILMENIRYLSLIINQYFRTCFKLKGLACL